MRGSLVCSVALHAAVLGWALITIQTQRELRVPEPEPIAVDLVTQSELTKLRQGVRTAKQLEAQPKENPKTDVAKKEAPKPTPVAAAPPPPEPPPPPPAPKEEPKPEPTKDPVAEKLASVPPPPQTAAPPPPVPAPEEQKRLDDLVREQEQQAQAQREEQQAQAQREEQQRREEAERKQAELKKKQEEERKRKEAELKKKRDDERKRKEAEAKKKEFDANKIAALLNKTPDKAPPPSAQEAEQPTKNKGPVLGAPEGRDRQLSASELAVLKQIIRSCVGPKWNVLGGGEEAQNTIVKIRVLFNPDGRLAAPPQIMNPQNSPLFLASAESALRAVQACEPYPLPANKYEAWRDTVLTLNPRDMF